MSHINVTINGRQYRMACEEGQEARLLNLAESFEARITSLRGKFGEIGDDQVGLTVAVDVGCGQSGEELAAERGDDGRGKCAVAVAE